eukprot:7113914-Pyramimonas_sp.AAC.1
MALPSPYSRSYHQLHPRHPKTSGERSRGLFSSGVDFRGRSSSSSLFANPNPTRLLLRKSSLI